MRVTHWKTEAEGLKENHDSTEMSESSVDHNSVQKQTKPIVFWGGEREDRKKRKRRRETEGR